MFLSAFRCTFFFSLPFGFCVSCYACVRLKFFFPRTLVSFTYMRRKERTQTMTLFDVESLVACMFTLNMHIAHRILHNTGQQSKYQLRETSDTVECETQSCIFYKKSIRSIFNIYLTKNSQYALTFLYFSYFLSLFWFVFFSSMLSPPINHFHWMVFFLVMTDFYYVPRAIYTV